eukprot:365169-Chlamydomonas_euryale.AAC.11
MGVPSALPATSEAIRARAASKPHLPPRHLCNSPFRDAHGLGRKLSYLDLGKHWAYRTSQHLESQGPVGELLDSAETALGNSQQAGHEMAGI